MQNHEAELAELNDFERELLDRIYGRLIGRFMLGRAKYGPLSPGDMRNWIQEANEEAADCLFYTELASMEQRC